MVLNLVYDIIISLSFEVRDMYMNEPVITNWTNNDVIEDYNTYNDKKIVARRYGITVKEVTQIINRGKKYVCKRG